MGLFRNMKLINFTEVKFKLHLHLARDVQECRVLCCLRSFSVARKRFQMRVGRWDTSPRASKWHEQARTKRKLAEMEYW